jgi:hypothetical protein
MGRRLFGIVCALMACATGASAGDLQKIAVGCVPVADFAPPLQLDKLIAP